MEQMIKNYEAEHKRLGERLAELRQLLRTGNLKTKERESVKLRMDLITGERVDLVHNIRSMRQCLEGVA